MKEIPIEEHGLKLNIHVSSSVMSQFRAIVIIQALLRNFCDIVQNPFCTQSNEGFFNVIYSYL